MDYFREKRGSRINLEYDGENMFRKKRNAKVVKENIYETKLEMVIQKSLGIIKNLSGTLDLPINGVEAYKSRILIIIGEMTHNIVCLTKSASLTEDDVIKRIKNLTQLSDESKQVLQSIDSQNMKTSWYVNEYGKILRV